jgi:hypothetical protein
MAEDTFSGPFDCAPMSGEADRGSWRSAQGDRPKNDCAKANTSADMLCQDVLFRTAF